MYAGFIYGCVGLGFLSATPDQLLSRVLITWTLACLLWYKADREEGILTQKYGADYYEWASMVPRFFPSPRALLDQGTGLTLIVGCIVIGGIVVASY